MDTTFRSAEIISGKWCMAECLYRHMNADGGFDSFFRKGEEVWRVLEVVVVCVWKRVEKKIVSRNWITMIKLPGKDWLSSSKEWTGRVGRKRG